MGPLTAEIAAHREFHAKIVRKGGRVVRVEYLTSTGGWSPDATGDVGFDVVYDGDTTTRLWFDRWRKPTGRAEIAGHVQRRLNPWRKPRRDSREESFITAMVEDERGFVVIERSVDEAGRPALAHGVHETRVRRDEEGRVLERSYFGIDGAPVANEKGSYRETYRIGTHGCVVEWHTFDAAGRLFGGALGVGRGRATCDAFGNRTSMRWFDAAGAPIVNRQGIHGWDRQFDERGAQRLSVSIGLDGRPAPTNGREASSKSDHDARGYLVATSYFGPNGEPFTDVDGAAGFQQTVLENGAVTRFVHLDANGRPTVTRDGYAEKRTRFDTEGNAVARVYLDASGRPAVLHLGYSIETFEFDEHRLWKTQTYRDADGRPVMTKNGYASVRATRDDEGHIVSRRHFGPDGAPVEVASARTMLISHQGVASGVDRPAAISKEEAQRRANEALRRLLSKESWAAVAKQLADPPVEEPRFAGENAWYAPIWQAIQQSRPGGPPVLIDTERGFFIVERKE